MKSSYNLSFSNNAKKYFKKLKKQDKKLLEKMNDAVSEIKANPYGIGEIKKGDLSGIYGYDVYHNGSNFEIAYKIYVDDTGDTILIILAGSRENFYQDLKRYLK